MNDHWKPAVARVVAAIALCTTGVSAQTARPDTACYVTTIGTDTVAIERYIRSGNTITGAWIQHQGGVYVHDYALVLGADGWPEQYVMTLYTSRPHTFLLSVTYGADSATRIMVRDANAVTERVVAQKAYPVGALSILATALGLERARRSGADSTTIPLDVAEVHGVTAPLSVKFFGEDSVRVGPSILARVDRSGRLLGLRQGPRETRLVASLAVAKLTAGFYAADSAARAARVAIDVPASALERLVGEYSFGPQLAMTVMLDGDKLMARVGNQPPTRLLASSPTKFFVEATLGVTFEFETDAAGNATALNLVSPGRRQRGVKTK